MSNGRSIFISGAATGIGAEVARRFLNLGWKVGVYDISEIDPEDYPTTAGTLVTGHLDVTDPEQWRQALVDFCGVGGSLDVLVNNAGILFSGPFEEITIEQHRATVEVNVAGTLNGCHTAHEYLFRARGATVVNLCSASAIYGQPELATYSATKFAVRGLTEALEIEWQKHDIRVLAMWPLFVATKMVDGMEIGSAKALGVRLGPEDVADELVAAVLYPSRMPKVHYPVGMQAKVLSNVAKFMPAWLNRATNMSFTGR